jgi:hypothetical protein
MANLLVVRSVLVLVVLTLTGATEVVPPATAVDTSFEANWMGRLSPVLSNLSLLNLSLPGTHDTMTYDLSTTISDNANDISQTLAWILHELAPILNILEIGEFVRTLAVTQGLNITQQLDAGIRFLDFRLTYSAKALHPSTDPYKWYCLHLLESNAKAIDYLRHVRSWLDDHPTEIIVLWFSHHGCNGCSDTYQVSAAIQRLFWANFTSMFNGILYDFSRGPLLQTTIAQMLSRNERVVVYAGEYENMTNSSNFAVSDALLDNQFAGDQSDPKGGVQNSIDTFRDSNDHIAQNLDQDGNMLYLVSMAGGADDQMTYATELTYFPWLINVTDTKAKCAALYGTPNMTEYCPMTLQEQSLMKNYYDQIAFEAAVQNRYGLPNAIYLGGVDVNGTFRVGPDYFSPVLPPVNPPRPYGDAKYSYTGTVALINVFRACPLNNTREECKAAEALARSRKELFPITRWQDDYYGRQSVWPL